MENQAGNLVHKSMDVFPDHGTWFSNIWTGEGLRESRETVLISKSALRIGSFRPTFFFVDGKVRNIEISVILVGEFSLFSTFSFSFSFYFYFSSSCFASICNPVD